MGLRFFRKILMSGRSYGLFSRMEESRALRISRLRLPPFLSHLCPDFFLSSGAFHAGGFIREKGHHPPLATFHFASVTEGLAEID